MSVDTGRKVVVQVSMTQRLLDKLDAIAERGKDPDEKKGNRSKLIRSFVAEGIARWEDAALTPPAPPPL
jgi:metal-responsive CopG/Arc/MetJ family transcriptional regulator